MTIPFASVTASTKRSPAISGGKRGAAVAHLVGLTITPFYPLDSETAFRFGVDTPYRMRQCFVDTADIIDGDILTVSSVDYPIKGVRSWPATSSTPAFLELIVEYLKS